MRAADADRERTLDVLRAAYGEGRLSKEEFDARSAAAMAARTYGELTALVADVPIGPVGQAPLPYQPPGGYYPAPRPPANGLAGASLVCSIIGLLMPILLIPGVVMGHVARDQIRARGQRGDGMALAGLVIGYLGAAFWALIIVIAATHGALSGLPGGRLTRITWRGRRAGWWTARRRRLPAGLPPGRSSSSASCPPSAARAACACG
jgi:hypothetical protein